MRQLKQLTAVFTIMMIVGLLLFIKIEKATAYAGRDIIYYNDLLHRVESDLKLGKPEEEIESEYGCAVIMSKEISDPELLTMYSEGALVLDLVVDDEYVGKVAWNDYKENHINTSQTFIKAAIILWISVLICGYLLLLYMYLGLVRPIGNLKEFTEDIAKGNLERPLLIDSTTSFVKVSHVTYKTLILGLCSRI